MNAWWENASRFGYRATVDPVLIHPLEPRSGLEGTRIGIIDGRWVLGRELVPARDRPVGHAGEHPPADDPPVTLEPLVVDDVGDVIPPLGHRQPRRPQVGDLGDVAIGVEDWDGRNHSGTLRLVGLLLG
jgi:hypothetical protein